MPYSSYTPGAGGAGGEVGATGGNGSLTVELTASCGCGTRSAYNVGKISDTEFIRWENEKLWRVVDGVYMEIAYETVNGGTGYLDGGKWYVVKGIVSRTGSITVGEGGAVNLVLLDRAALMVDSPKNNYQAGIGVAQGRALNIFGIASGALTANGGIYGAGIGGGNEQSAGTLTVYGGTVNATGLYDAAGIGGGSHGAGGTVTINGGMVTAAGGYNAAGIGGGRYGAGGTVTINGGSVTATGGDWGADIGGGYEGSSQGSLHLGPSVFKIDDNHYQEGAGVSFVVPSYLRLVSATADNGAQVKISTMAETTCVFALSALRMTLTFVPGDVGYSCIDNDKVVVDLIDENRTLPASDLPKVEEDLIAGLVEYLLPNGGASKASEVRRINQAASQQSILSSGWYMVTGEVTTADLEVQGTVNLILADGATLTVDGGIWVDKGKELAIYGQAAGSGALIANGGDFCAGIGGQNPHIKNGYGDCGTVTINGGTVTTMGGALSAGIGGGERGAGGTVTINGGTVKAIGGLSGAGIGGGNGGTGGTVMVSGGSIKASSIQSQPKNAANDSVYCVTVPCATSPGEIAGLGDYGTRDIVPIDGKVYLYLPNGEHEFTIDGVKYRAVVSGGATTAEPFKMASFTLGEHVLSVSYTTEPDVAHGTATDDFTLVLLQGTKITLNADCEAGYDYLGVEEFTVGKENMQITIDAVPKVEYCDGQGNVLKAEHATDFDLCIAGNTIGGGKWYVVKGKVECETITVNGSANLILADGAKLTVNGGEDHAGIEVTEGNSLTIWGQTKGTGELEATGGDYGAGIGGGDGGTGGTVTINGGTVMATGVFCGAGIGGGRYGAGGTVTINGGTVMARGGYYGAGIGGGRGGTGDTVTIYGGKVTAMGGEYGAGIGGGRSGTGGEVTIYGGEVTATGGEYGAGIGGGRGGSTGGGGGDEGGGTGGTVTIYGGTVTATGGELGAGIGGGQNGDGGTVTIYGGTVMATGGELTIRMSGAGVGGGYEGADGTVTLDETRVEVVEGAVGNGHLYVKIVEKKPVGPTCEGGEIVEGDGGAWVVTPEAGVTEVTVAGLPDGDTVAVPPTVAQVNGVADAQIKVRSGVYDITGAFAITGGAIALNENGAVTIGGETIPVKPTIGDLGDYATEPFTVGEGSVTVTVKAIPGLKYSLVRGTELGAITKTVVEPTLATGATVTLTDGEPHRSSDFALQSELRSADMEGAAFYKVVVSVP